MDEPIGASHAKQRRRYTIYDDDDDEDVDVAYEEPDQQLAQPIEDEDIFGEGIRNNSGEKSPPPAPRVDAILTPKEKLKQNLAEQVRKLGLMPKEIDTKQKFIELPSTKGSINIATPPKKLTIDKFFKPVKRSIDTVTPEKKYISREQHIKSLEKKICADKRKIWDSTRAPVEDIDDEEMISDEEEKMQAADDIDEEEQNSEIDGKDQESEDDVKDQDPDSCEEDQESEDSEGEEDRDSEINEEDLDSEFDEEGQDSDIVEENQESENDERSTLHNDHDDSD